MNIYWVSLEVIFNEPLQNDFFGKDDPKNLTRGFFQNIGCTAENKDELEEILQLFLIKIEFLDLYTYQYEVGLISHNEIDTEIYGDPDLKDSLIADPICKGIWYHTGRGFYWDDDESDENDDFYQVKIEKNK